MHWSDRILRPIHRWVWHDATRRAHKLLRFGETETDGGRDLVRASELTSDPLLRRLYLVHAIDEHRHGEMFRRRGAALLRVLPAGSSQTFQAGWLTPSGHGADDLEVGEESDDTLLAFLHISEKAAAGRFTVYSDVLHHDERTRAIFQEILHDEVFHMNYTLVQLERVSPKHHRRRLWFARLNRLWKGYLRLATALGGAMGGAILTLEYFLVLPPFALLAKRAEKRAPEGWSPIAPGRNDSSRGQY